MFQIFKKKKKIGLCVRGGAGRSLSYLGVLKFFEENNIQIHAVVAASGGAIILSSYGAGRDIDFILKHGMKMSIRSLTSLKSLSHLKAFDTDKALAHEWAAVGENTTFDDLKFKMGVQVTKYPSYESAIIETGNVGRVVLASSANAEILEPVEIDGQTYVDGEYSAGFDTSYLRKHGCNVVIGLRAGAPIIDKHDIASETINSMYKLIRNLQNESLKHASLDLLLDQTAGNDGSGLDFTKGELYMQRGYEVAKKHADQILDLCK